MFNEIEKRECVAWGNVKWIREFCIKIIRKLLDNKEREWW